MPFGRTNVNYRFLKAASQYERTRSDSFDETGRGEIKEPRVTPRYPAHNAWRTAGTQAGTVKCIPEEPLFGEGRLAEKVVWDALRAQLPDDVVLAHSVQVRHGRAEHEIDILVLWPGVGLAAIEVKGGRISVQQGQWYQSDRQGPHRIESPIAQSQGAQHAFKMWVQDQLGSPLANRFAYIAAFPYSTVPRDWEMAGVPRPLILDADDLGDCCERLRAAIETQAQGGSPLALTYARRITDQLSGNLEAGTAPSLTALELEDLQEQLTERQKVLLDCSRSIPRVRFVGGAGSGKTWLAVEKAKRLAKEGKRVGLFCYNRGLAEHLRRQVAGCRQAKPVYVGGFHDYAVSLGVPDGSGQAYFDEDMPALMRDLAAVLPPGAEAGRDCHRRGPGLRSALVAEPARLPSKSRRRGNLRLHGRAPECLRTLGFPVGGHCTRSDRRAGHAPHR